MASYGVRPRYGLVTYATVPKVLVRVSDERSSDADWVTEKLNQISYEGQRLGKGKLGGALWGCGGQRLGVLHLEVYQEFLGNGDCWESQGQVGEEPEAEDWVGLVVQAFNPSIQKADGSL